ncbi:hypothetical protein FQR65_LT02285 [Abscondita terminalis]|nr:hypothetical protein FQR65_LT02285 [Abscondita terminalis]
MCENELLNVAEHEKWNILDILLNSIPLFGYNINARNEKGNALIHILAEKNSKLLDKTIRNGADVNIRNQKGKTALHVAVETNNNNSVVILVKAGADLNILDYLRETAVFKAARFDNGDALKYLIKKGAATSIVNKDESNLLHLASGNCKQSEIVKLLLELKIDVNATNRSNHTPLFIAFSKGNLQIAKLLMRHGANVDCLYQNMKTPILHNAILQQQTEIVKELIDVGISVNFRNKYGETPIHLAVENELFKLFEFLINKGGFVNAKDKDGYSPLHLAANNKDLKYLKVLLQKDALINIQTLNGDSPLHRAASRGNQASVEYLLNNSAEINLQNIDGCTPLHLAISNGHTATVNYLIKRGANSVFDKTISKAYKMSDYIAVDTSIPVSSSIYKTWTRTWFKNLALSSKIRFTEGRKSSTPLIYNKCGLSYLKFIPVKVVTEVVTIWPYCEFLS